MRNDMFLITPMNQKVYLNRGEEYRGSIRVVNPAEATRDFHYRVDVAPYGVVGEGYDADLTSESQWTQIVDWITVENNEGVLAPNEVRDVEFVIKVPEDAIVGAQTAALVVRQEDNEKAIDGVKVENVFEMASIIYGQVLGIEKHDAAILAMDVPGFSTTPDVAVTASFDNHGNVFEEAKTKIVVKNALSGEVILPTSEASGEYTEIVMPDTTRKVTRKIDDLPMLGVVHVEYQVKYNGEEMMMERDLVICPIWFMVMMAAVVGMIITTIVMLIKKYHKKA